MNLRLASVAGLTIFMLATPAAFPQDLADAAKKEQARRKKVTPAGAAKVYTETDLPPLPPGVTPSAATAEKGSSRPGAPRTPAAGATSEDQSKQAIAEYRAAEAEFKERISAAEAQVQQLASHPTGGGKVCRIPEGVFQPAVTAPEQVVCPYQMESRYERAKRELEALRSEFARFQETARRSGIRF